MRKLASVKVGGKSVKIVFDESCGDELYGEWISGKNTIRLNPDQTLSEREATIFHELVHAALSISGVSEVLGEKREEAVAHCLENLLFPLYKRK